MEQLIVDVLKVVGVKVHGVLDLIIYEKRVIVFVVSIITVINNTLVVSKNLVVPIIEALTILVIEVVDVVAVYKL